MKPQYFIRVEGFPGGDQWHGPFEVFPERKLKSLLIHDPNEAYDYTVYRCQVVPINWDKI